MFDEVNLEEYPSLAEFGTRHITGMSSFQQRDRMHLEEVGGFLQGECVHEFNSRNKPSLRSFGHLARYVLLSRHG
ncbi:MAG: hypothetical protein H6R01_1480 [Burkholderiaceae bacterium]|nr:hypothetical protein [Burkholderiaceae bacterium]